MEIQFLQIAELKDISPLLAGALGGIATLLAVSVTSFFNLRVAKINIEAQSRQKAKELKLQKLEELFFLFDKWQINFSNIYLCHLRCYKGKLEFKQVLDHVNNLSLLAPGEAQKYKMLMEIHFPSLVSEYAVVEQARVRIVPFLTDPAESKLEAQAFENCQVAFEEAAVSFKEKVSSLAHKTLEK